MHPCSILRRQVVSWLKSVRPAAAKVRVGGSNAGPGQETPAPSPSLRQPQLGIEGENKGSGVIFAFFGFPHCLFPPTRISGARLYKLSESVGDARHG